MEPDEGRNAEVAREMLVSGDWITPHYNSLVYLDKPAVFFWMVAATFRVAGISEWAARFPSALAALGTLLLTWYMARKMFGDAAGLRAGIIWATMPLVIIFSRLVIFDMALTFFVTLAMLAFWLANSGEFAGPWLDVLMFAACGIATITKGPVGFLLPFLSILVFLAWAGRLGDLKRIQWLMGSIIFLATTLPWFLAATFRNPDFPRYAFWQESLQRFATGSAHRGGSLFYYLPVFLAGMLPWSIILIFLALNRLGRWRELRNKANRSILFLLSWTILIFVFFTISHSKLPAYVLPATVPLSILISQAWMNVEANAASSSRAPDWLRAGFATLIAVGLLAAAASWELLNFTSIRMRAVQKIDPLVLHYIKPSVFFSGLILAAIGVLGRNLAERQRGRFAPNLTFLVLVLTTPVLAVRWLPALRAYAAVSSSRGLARTILSSPQRNLEIDGFYFYRTSLPFYLRRPVGLVTTDGGQITSNYIALHYSRFRAVGQEMKIGSPDSGVEKGGNSPLTSYSSSNSPGHLPIPFGGLLMDATDFRSKLRALRAPLLILAPNDQVQTVIDTVPSDQPPQGMWTDWRETVWEIPTAPRLASASH